MKVNQFLSFYLFAICAMLGVATNRVLAEDAPGILVIVKANYGDLPSGDQSDVTEKVKAMVKNNSLTVEATNENFDDPAEGIVKKLSVEYTIDGVKQSKTVDENETLTISGKDSTGKGKLVIHKAFYGDLPDGDKTDVTAKVAAAVKNDGLSIEATNENFDDPAEGIVKKLFVEYTIDGVKQSKTVDENETLTISGKGKLVIRKAFYGDLPDGDKTDVTAKVAAAVKNDGLSIEATNENFDDPAEGIVKKLTVDYTFEGKEKSKTVDENETLTISDKGE